MEAVEWYVRRGFVVEEGVIEGYYRKLRPSGAKIVRRKIGVGDWLGVKAEEEGEVHKDSSVGVDSARAIKVGSG